MKFFKRFLFTLFCLTIILPIGAMTIPPLLNDIKLSLIERSLNALPLPDNTALLESKSFCGNTGEELALWTAILIRSDLSPESLQAYYSDKIVVRISSDHLDQFDFLGAKSKLQSLDGIRDFSGLFLVYSFDSAVSQYDLRGA